MDTILILESIEDVENLTKFLDRKVILLTTHKDFKNLSPIIQDFYRKTIIPWGELWISEIEPDKNRETEIKNKILDFINFLDNIH